MKFRKIRLWSKIGLSAKILIVFLALPVVSLVVITYFTLSDLRRLGEYASERNLSLGEWAVSNSTNALQNQAEEYLLRLAKDQADISNVVFKKVVAETNIMAEYASTLWSNPSFFTYRLSHSREEKPDDVYSSSVYILAPSISPDAVRKELDLLSNIDNILAPIYANDPNLTRVYIGTASGIYRALPWFSDFPPSYDARKRSWYERAVETGEIGWTELYVSGSTGELMVTCSRPVYGPEKELVAVVGTDVTLEVINELIINSQIGDLGYAFLIDNNGNIVARPGLSAKDKRWDESFETENLLANDNPELKRIAADMIAGNSGIVSFESDQKYIAYAAIASPNWSLAIVVPLEEIIAPALTTGSQISSASKDTQENINRRMDSMQKTFIGIFFVTLLAVSLLAFLLSRMITRPVLRVTHAARAMERGELTAEETAILSQSKGRDEVALLSRVFASMATQVKGREHRLKKQVKKLQIEIDQTRKGKEVAKITENDYFQYLQDTVRKMREKAKEE